MVSVFGFTYRMQRYAFFLEKQKKYRRKLLNSIFFSCPYRTVVKASLRVKVFS